MTKKHGKVCVCTSLTIDNTLAHKNTKQQQHILPCSTFLAIFMSSFLFCRTIPNLLRFIAQKSHFHYGRSVFLYSLFNCRYAFRSFVFFFSSCFHFINSAITIWDCFHKTWIESGSFDASIQTPTFLRWLEFEKECHTIFRLYFG